MSDDFESLLGGTPSASPAAPPAVVTVPAPAGGERAMGAFEGADRLNSSIALWGSPLQSIDLDVLPEKPVIDGRARDMLRNDAFVQGGAALHKDNIVGSHYLLNCRPATKVLFGKEDETWEEEFQEEVEEKWELYSDSPDNWIDASRTNNFTALVRMAVGVHLMAGEMLAAIEYVTDDWSPYNTAIQMVDLDRLSDPRDRVLPWNTLPNQRAGIRYNDRGAPQSYFIRKGHPNDFGPVDFSFDVQAWKEIDRYKPWGRLQIIHLFEQVRPDQSRGVTEMAAALSVMKKSHTWRDINIQHAAAQAAVVAAITSELPMNDIAQRMNGESAEAYQAAMTAYAEGFLGSVAKYVGGKGFALDGVKIPRLYPGEKLELKTPASGPLGTEFEQSMLRYIAAALGVSYEQLSRDYTHTNYSSARAAMAETWKFMSARKKLIADRFATLVFRAWLEEAINKGRIETAKRIPIYDPPRRGERYGRLNENFTALSRCDWVGASRGQIDELKETQAAVLRISNGLSTAEDELARLGKDFRKVYRQLAREQKLRETLGLTFMSTDPATMAAMNALSGNTPDDGGKPRE